MNTYYVWINCTAGIHETPKECGPDVTNCGQVHFLKFESNDPKKDLAEIRKKYAVTSCPVGKAKRYLATGPLENGHINGQEPLTVEDLVPRKRGIEARFLEEE